MPSLFVACLVLRWLQGVVTPRHSRRRRLATLLFVVGILCKELDSLKLVCYRSWRHGPFQLTAIYHGLLGLSFSIDTICAIDLRGVLHYDDPAAVRAKEGGPQK